MTQEQYLSAGAHIGMKQQTKDMKKFVYKIRGDGLAILDVQKIDERVKIAAKFLSKFNRIMVVSRKPTGQKAAVRFSEAVGGKAVIGRFLPGIVTNPSFKEYWEPDVLLVTDPLIDKQAVSEAVKMRKPIVALCDTFNETVNVDLVIPCNNKGRKSIAIIYWMLAKEILALRGAPEADFTAKPEDFEAEEDMRERSDRPERSERY